MYVLDLRGREREGKTEAQFKSGGWGLQLQAWEPQPRREAAPEASRLPRRWEPPPHLGPAALVWEGVFSSSRSGQGANCFYENYPLTVPES